MLSKRARHREEGNKERSWGHDCNASNTGRLVENSNARFRSCDGASIASYLYLFSSYGALDPRLGGWWSSMVNCPTNFLWHVSDVLAFFKPPSPRRRRKNRIQNRTTASTCTWKVTEKVAQYKGKVRGRPGISTSAISNTFLRAIARHQILGSSRKLSPTARGRGGVVSWVCLTPLSMLVG